MNFDSSLIKVVRKLRQMHSRIKSHDAFGPSYENATVTGQAASNLIRRRLLDDAPAMICRIGNVELRGVLTHEAARKKVSAFRKAMIYIRGESEAFWWDDETIRTMCHNAGFFPPNLALLERFGQLMLDDMKEVDILGTWQKQERLLDGYMPHAVKVSLPDLEPYYHSDPWTSALSGRTVLVVHPYEESIRRQYANRALLFDNPAILPAFKIKTLKAVQSIGNTKTGYQSWFEALDHMRAQISATDFDIAIIGCGAYGFPLAAHVKRIGRKALHLGGATQILFGIRGKRWEEHPFISKLMNDHWTRPVASEIPAASATVEAGAYW